jgi:hypothetical protein
MEIKSFLFMEKQPNAWAAAYDLWNRAKSQLRQAFHNLPLMGDD